MTTISDDFKIEYVSRKPTRIVPLGSIHALYLPRLVARSFIFNKKYVYPSIAPFKKKNCIAFFFDYPPEEYDAKSYKIYRLKRNKTYLPVPADISPIFGNLKKSLLNYYFGKDKGHFILLLRRLKDEED